MHEIRNTRRSLLSKIHSNDSRCNMVGIELLTSKAWNRHKYFPIAVQYWRDGRFASSVSPGRDILPLFPIENPSCHGSSFLSKVYAFLDISQRQCPLRFVLAVVAGRPLGCCQVDYQQPISGNLHNLGRAGHGYIGLI